jgi:hypothetical protein
MPTVLWILASILFALLLGFALSARKKLNKESVLQTWTAYVSGQGIMLFSFLVLGAIVASGFVYLGPIRSEAPQTGGVLLEPRRIVLDEQHPIYTKRLGSLDRYRRITILTRTTSEPASALPPAPVGDKPPGAQGQSAGTAAIVIERTLRGANTDEIRRIQATSEAWTQWEEQSPKGELNLIIEPGAGSPTKTIVELIVYFTPK